ncbi:hypothetical protein HPB51_017819 [Rhipicephalus microplus]|uniref:Uncharacterized protein n=1 Tax=Rhipicephalus microplus TaxID=6941 RepID=A0A9J6DWP0_RHIMP|nr:hypothetical protein HPB51_017819 [Rhipicephalus microplus]
MYEVLEYHFPHDLKHCLTYFTWSPRSYIDLRDTVLKFYGLKRAPPPTSDTRISGSLPFRTPPAPQAVQIVPLPTTGHTGNGEQPSMPIDLSFERPTTLEFTDPASDGPVLPTKALPLRSIADSTLAAAPCAVRFAVETWSAALSAPGDSTISVKPADLPADFTPLPTPLEAHDTTHTVGPELVVVLHTINLPSTPMPAAQTLVDCQSNHDVTGVSSGSQGF